MLNLIAKSTYSSARDSPFTANPASVYPIYKTPIYIDIKIVGLLPESDHQRSHEEIEQHRALYHNIPTITYLISYQMISN